MATSEAMNVTMASMMAVNESTRSVTSTRNGSSSGSGSAPLASCAALAVSGVAMARGILVHVQRSTVLSQPAMAADGRCDSWCASRTSARLHAQDAISATTVGQWLRVLSTCLPNSAVTMVAANGNAGIRTSSASMSYMAAMCDLLHVG